MICPHCKRDIATFRRSGSKGGSVTGPTKSRDPEKMRQAALKRWAKKG